MRQIAGDAVPALLAGQTAPAGLLSNGSYTVLLTAAGTGVSSRRGVALTHGPGDRVEDSEGFFLYLRDPESGRAWSAGFAPTRIGPGPYAAGRAPGRIVIEREDDGIATRCAITVDPDADRELRRLTLVNGSERTRRIEVTSCVEVVLNDPAAHASHPAFSKLFIQTEWDARLEALLAHRRPRGHGEAHPWMAHAVWNSGSTSVPAGPGVHLTGGTSCETDRARFLGRGRGWDQPLAIGGDPSLSGTTGNVLDPVLALRREVTLAPGGSAELVFVLGAADTREEALQLVVPGISPAGSGNDIFTRAARQEEALPGLSGLTAKQARHAEALAAAMLLGNPGLRAAPEILARARGRLVDLERLGVPRSRPYALLHAERPAGKELLPVLLAMHRHWLALGMPVSLVVICASSAAVTAAPAGPASGLVVLRAADLSSGTSDVLDAAARLVVTDRIPGAPLLPWIES